MSHLKREALASRFPVHVTMKIAKGLPSLRIRAAYRVVCEAFDKGCKRAGRLEGGVFRLVHYSVQGDHLHLVCEAKDRASLSRGVQGLSIRIARGLNRLWERKGKVFADRYHDRILRTPREVRNVLRYVFNNARRPTTAACATTAPMPSPRARGSTAGATTCTTASWAPSPRSPAPARGY